MKLKLILAIVVSVSVLLGQVGLHTHVYADQSERPFDLPDTSRPPVNAGVIEVSTFDQLLYVSWYQELYRDKHIKLMNSINMFNNSWIPWIPIKDFIGTFDGNYYDISNMNIYQSVTDTTSQTWGMFANIGFDAVIKNMTLTNFTVSGTALGMGILAGANYGEITNVGIIGGMVDQRKEDQTPLMYAGGLVGYNNSRIENVYSTSMVKSNNNSNTISHVGGIAGANAYHIENAYATGAISTNSIYKDGLASLFLSYPSLSFYDRETTGIGENEQRSVDLSTEEMLDQDSYNKYWDFENTWSILPGKTYPYLKSMRTVTPEVLSSGFENTAYIQQLQIPTSNYTPSDLIWEAVSLPIGLSLGNDGTISGTPTSNGDHSITVVVYSPSTHIVYGSGSISLTINPPPASNSPTKQQIDISNNLAPAADTVTVGGLQTDDIIKIYSAADGNLLSSATVPSGQTSVSASVDQLGTIAGQVYVSVTNPGKSESTRTAKAYEAESTPTPTPTPTPTSTPTPSPTPSPTPKPEIEQSTPVFNDKVNADVVRDIIEKAHNAPKLTFSDVPASSWSATFIDLAGRMGIVKGYEDGSFNPTKIITRAEFADMLAKALSLNGGSGFFPDVQGHWAEHAIQTLKSNGIIIGYRDGLFKPDQPITRAEMVTMMTRVLDIKTFTTGKPFSDIQDHWAEDAIIAAAHAGLVSGIGDNKFDPDAHATREQAVAMIIRMLNLTLGLKL